MDERRLYSCDLLCHFSYFLPLYSSILLLSEIDPLHLSRPFHPSLLWHCSLGCVTCKKLSPKWPVMCHRAGRWTLHNLEQKKSITQYLSHVQYVLAYSNHLYDYKFEVMPHVVIVFPRLYSRTISTFMQLQLWLVVYSCMVYLRC